MCKVVYRRRLLLAVTSHPVSVPLITDYLQSEGLVGKAEVESDRDDVIQWK